LLPRLSWPGVDYLVMWCVAARSCLGWFGLVLGCAAFGAGSCLTLSGSVLRCCPVLLAMVLIVL
jgi:hypothetical protein